MNLLVDCHSFDYNTTEGINTYIKGLYSELVKVAQDIDFYFVAQNTDKIQNIFGTKQNIHYIPLSSKNKIYRLLFEFPAIIKKYKIDFAHYQYTSPLIKNCRNITTLHDILFLDYPNMFPFTYRFVKNLLFKRSAKNADLLLTVSNYSAKQISLHYEIPLKNIIVTPNAVSEDFYDINKDEATNFIQNLGIEKYILYVSRIEPRKNQLALLQAYNELRLYQENYHLVFIGRRTLPTLNFDNYYEQLPKSTKKYIHIYNQVSYPELKLWYRATDLFVYPALAEGFGIPPIEAGAAGVPCICSNRTAMGDFKFFGNNLIDPTNNEELKKQILENLQFNNTDKILEIQKQIFSTYNWKSIATHFYAKLKNHF